MNEFRDDMEDTADRTRSEHHVEALRQQGGVFVEAVRLTRMPMLVTDPALPGNPIIFANAAFEALSGYAADELVGQDPHFMNGADTDPAAIKLYEAAIEGNRDETLEILQYGKNGRPFRAMLFASPLTDGQGRIVNHFLSYLDVTRRFDAEEDLRRLTADLERRVAERTAELEAVNRTLSDLVAEREMLLVEVNHRAKNSLAIAASLLSLQGRRQTDPATKILFEEARERLNGMARMHDLLSRSETTQHIDVATYMRDLCDALRSMTENDGRISVEAKAEDGILVSADTAVPLGLVLTEIVTNAVKYAFPPPRSGRILAQARRAGSGTFELLIRDDGVGSSELREGSLGFGLVRSLVEQIKGEISVRNDDGFSVTIVFPDPSTMAESETATY